jgi:site-specific recombinase XerD
LHAERFLCTVVYNMNHSDSAVLSKAPSHWASEVRSKSMTPGSAARYQRVLESFERFLAAADVTSLADITPELCHKFLSAPLPGRHAPSPSTARFRLTVVRSAFAAMSTSCVVQQDPTSGLTVRHRPSRLVPRPLTPPEVLRLRAGARLRPRDTIRPACVELALVGLTHTEIAAAVVADLANDARRLGVTGASARILEIDRTGGPALTLRVQALRRQQRSRRKPVDETTLHLGLHRPLSDYARESIAPSISSSLSRAIAAAGLHGPDIRPRSLREYAGNAFYARTGDIEETASRLGLKSLDVARSLIDDTWQRAWREVIRCDDG